MVRTVVSASKARKRYMDLRVIEVEVTDLSVAVRKKEESGMGSGRWWMAVLFTAVRNIGKRIGFWMVVVR